VTPIVVTPPAIEPVSLPEAKLWLDSLDQDDDLVSALIKAAREFCEHRKGYAFYEQTLRVVLTGWPCGTNRIRLPRATPLREIISVTYTDSDGTHTVEAADYAIDANSIPGAVVFGSSYSWPSVDVWAPNPITIEYIAGAAIESPEVPLPTAVKIAMRQLIAHWYRNREAVIVGASAAATSVPMELGVDALLGVNQQIFAC
jgi:uncharacterized phiE125 gp8 family phage protein